MIVLWCNRDRGEGKDWGNRIGTEKDKREGATRRRIAGGRWTPGEVQRKGEKKVNGVSGERRGSKIEQKKSLFPF